MINVETIIGNILQPLRDDGTIGFYHFGNETELKEVFTSYQFNQKYPFVWLVMPFSGSPTENLAEKQIDTRIRLLLVTGSKLEWLNDKRNIETYEKVLNPLYDKMMSTFTKNLQIIIKNNDVNVKKLHNYYDESQGTRANPSKNQVLDYCDIIQVEFDCIITERADCNVKTRPQPEPNFVLIINGQVLTLGNNTVLTI